MQDLVRLLEERGILRRRATGGEGDAERRALERRVERLAKAREQAERERDEAVAERDAAEERFRTKSAECDALQAELRRRTADGDARPTRDGTADDKLRAAKRDFAKRFHPDRLPARSVERTVREEVFKEYWQVLQRIENT